MPRGRSLAIPSPSLVVMVGPAGSGKSSFCRRTFVAGQIVSSDACRAMLSDHPEDQTATAPAFALAHWIVEERLRRNLLTVFDATSVDRAARRKLLQIAALHHVPVVAVVLDLPLEECLRHDRLRSDRHAGRMVIARQAHALRASLPGLRFEGFAGVHRIRSARAATRASIVLMPSACDRRSDRGPLDIIGDVHGCAGELVRLLRRLGYRRASPRLPFRHPTGRRAVFVGDLVDRGPRIVPAARIVMRMVAAATALCVPGNHDVELVRCLDGRDAALSPGSLGTISPGTRRSIQQIEALPRARGRRFVAEIVAFVRSLPSHLVLDDGRLAVAHAGLKSEHVGRDSDEVRRFAVHGETTGGIDRYGLSVRVKWAAAYRGRTLVVYGHTPVPRPEWLNRTVNIDTGCVYGGQLTALRYPEMETIGVPARRVYYRSPRAIPGGVGLRAETRSIPTA